MRRVISSVVISSFLLAGCASNPDKIQASYVSPLTYSTYNCNQIRMELARVTRRVHEVTGQQSDAATGDAVAMGVGLVLFWPALFFLMGSDHEEELARLKGEYEALESAAIQKECNVADELEKARALREKRDADRKELEKELHQVND